LQLLTIVGALLSVVAQNFVDGLLEGSFVHDDRVKLRVIHALLLAHVMIWL